MFESITVTVRWNSWYFILRHNCLLLPKGIIQYITLPSFINIFDTCNFYCRYWKIRESVLWEHPSLLTYWTSCYILLHPVLQNPLNSAFLAAYKNSSIYKNFCSTRNISTLKRYLIEERKFNYEISQDLQLFKEKGEIGFLYSSVMWIHLQTLRWPF